MKKLWVTSVVLALSGAVFVYADDDDDDTDFRAKLDSYQQVVTLSTAGRGDFRASVTGSGMSGEIRYRLTYSGLEGGAALAAHIHLGARATNGGVIAPLCGGGSTPACPVTGGTVEGIIRAVDIVGPAPQGIVAFEFDEAVRAMRAGATYVNVHTVVYPGGEIRGQIRGD